MFVIRIVNLDFVYSINTLKLTLWFGTCVPAWLRWSLRTGSCLCKMSSKRAPSGAGGDYPVWQLQYCRVQCLHRCCIQGYLHCYYSESLSHQIHSPTALICRVGPRFEVASIENEQKYFCTAWQHWLANDLMQSQPFRLQPLWPRAKLFWPS